MTNTQSTLTLTSDEIELYKVLKAEGLASSGAEAKMLIAEGLVSVNGAVETRKRKKIKAGDVINFENHSVSVIS